MRAAIFNGPGAVEAGERPDPVIQEPTDAVVRVVLGCVRGSDLWYYRGESPHAAGSIGHEFIGIVEQAGADVQGIKPGDLVVASFIYSDMSCPHGLNGSTISCPAGGNFGDGPPAPTTPSTTATAQASSVTLPDQLRTPSPSA
jgi:threonine dehydrogenase-like Zn-dependent dehydrogenase